MFHSVLSFAGVQNGLFEIVRGVQALPVPFDGPHRTPRESPVELSQSSCAIRLQLVADGAAHVAARGDHNMDMVGPWIGGPQTPLTEFAMTPNLEFEDLAMFVRQEDDGVSEPISLPLLQLRLWR